MRWYWIDRFLEFESGSRAKAVKNISLAEDHLHDHFKNYPTIPNSLVIEGFAQAGGLLICEHNQFTEKVVLAKIGKAKFYSAAIPGDSLVYTTVLESITSGGGMISATSYKGDQLHAEAELFFAHVSDSELDSFFDAETYLRMMRLLGAFDVGHAPDGSRLVPPPSLIEAVEAELREKEALRGSLS